ncbi:uncharacterized protein MELLADRAFT_102224 [Melampsora larici-populina 98AG31]|uniref:Uncharacterized protein n=1 Tax=Melampsora larici-populina (strain 98AG31 / pathotype 3-4-7) TaxID=747676 RepID=F4R7L2_MELLP|nr:uncharacterized protein MELLADRAFT_102224 [Melampsora larici-populina 98AG31]EGG11766.1 hypothetical protein MELLADRAFT_102224 [Melampsora larici-populina 98AG31]
MNTLAHLFSSLTTNAAATINDDIYGSTSISQPNPDSISIADATSNSGTSETRSTNSSIIISHEITYRSYPPDPYPMPSSLSYTIASELTPGAEESHHPHVGALLTPADPNPPGPVAEGDVIEPESASLKRQRLEDFDEKLEGTSDFFPSLYTCIHDLICV